MDTHRLPLEVTEPSGVPRRRWPVGGGIPFARGALPAESQLHLRDETGTPVPLQARRLSAWPDGSVRWAGLHFQVDLEARATARLTLEHGPEAAPATPAGALQVTRDGKGFTLVSGPLHLRISTAAGLSPLDQVWVDGQPMLADAEPAGFRLVDAAGHEFDSCLGRVTEAEVEEAGPVRAVLHFRGDHRSLSGERLFGYELRLYAHAGLPWIEMEYTFVNDADAPITELRSIGLQVQLRPGEAWQGRCGADEIARGAFGLAADTPERARLTDENGRTQRELAAGPGWVDVTSARGGLTLAVRHWAQLAPKALRVGGGAVQLDLWPASAVPLRWHQGMARTHRLLWRFHSGSAAEMRAADLGAAYEQDLLVCSPGACVTSAALGPLLPFQPDRYPNLERALGELHRAWRSTNRAFGFTDYGDFPQTVGAWRQAGYLGNNQHDLAHALALQFARTGQRECLEDLEAAAWHLMDVDVIHHTTRDPLEQGGARMQGTGHVQYNCEGLEAVSVAPSQMWIEGLLEYYALSGHLRALELARGIGECFLRMLERGWARPPFHVRWHGSRDSGWPLIGLLALYEMTGEARWLAGARRIAEALLMQQGEEGGWDMWFGWRRCLAPLHLGITLTGLCRYHALTGDERVRTSLIRAAQALLSQCASPEGALFYVDAPGFHWNYYCGGRSSPWVTCGA